MAGEGAELWVLRDGGNIKEDDMEIIDRKFIFVGVSRRSQKRYTEKNAVLFLVKDALLPDLLEEYMKLCQTRGVDERQITGVSLLKERVVRWQRKNVKLVHVPDVEAGKEEKRVNAPNRS